MNLTFAGCFALLFIFLTFLKLNGKFYILPTVPFFMICLRFYLFFGYYSHLDVSLKTDSILLCSFIIFVISYYFGYKNRYNNITKKINLFLNRKKTQARDLVKSKVINKYIIIIILYFIFDLCLNTYIYGSLEDALTRFYVKDKQDDIPNILITMQTFFILALSSFIFVIRYFQNYYKKYNKLIYIAVGLLVLISFPKGSRGAAGMPILMIFLADVFSKRYIGGFKFITKLREYFLLFFISLFLFLSLTFIRNMNFDNVDSLDKQLREFNISQGADKYNETETDLMIGDAQFVFNTYGAKYPFLGPTYTLGAIAMNPIPRFIYPNKPIGFGTILTEAKYGKGDFSVINLISYKHSFAVGVAGEGWANYGIVGVILYSIFFGIYSGFFSRLFQTFIKSTNYLCFLFALLFFQCSYSFIRGDLLSGVTQGVYPIIVLSLFIKLFYKK